MDARGEHILEIMKLVDQARGLDSRLTVAEALLVGLIAALDNLTSTVHESAIFSAGQLTRAEALRVNINR